MMARRSFRAMVATAALFAGGCTSLVRQTARAASGSPWSLAPAEQRLRDAMASGLWNVALRASSEKAGAPADRLLRDLYFGTAAYYASQWDSSGAAFARAAALADDRYTKSVTRGALSLATSDLALPYVPGHNERLMVHYYGMLSWLRRGSLDEATVEARRIGQMLEEYDGSRNDLDVSTRAMLRAVTGVVFEAAGEQDDAAVAYRNARALSGGALPWDADTAATLAVPVAAKRTARGKKVPNGPSAVVVPDSGDVLVIVEQGFVAHRVEQRLVIRGDDDALDPARAASLLAGDDGIWTDSSRAPLMIDLDATTAEPPRRARSTSRVKLAWPAFRRPIAIAVARVAADGTLPNASTRVLRADVSDGAAGDFKRDRGVRLARLLLRAATRTAAVAELERKHKDVGSLVSAIGNGIDRADTRSWHLLPGAITVARLRLPVGAHTITAHVDGDALRVATVTVVRGTLAFATTRLWSGAASALPTLAVRDTAHPTTTWPRE